MVGAAAAAARGNSNSNTHGVTERANAQGYLSVHGNNSSANSNSSGIVANARNLDEWKRRRGLAADDKRRKVFQICPHLYPNKMNEFG